MSAAMPLKSAIHLFTSTAKAMTRPNLGWECPRCGSTHAPSVPSCHTCDDGKNPRVPAYLIRVLERQLNDVLKSCEPGTPSPEVTINAYDLQRLLEGVKGR